MKNSNSQHDLLVQYKKVRRDLIAAHDLSGDKAERSILADMISDAEYVMEWLSCGRQPGARRGIDRRSVYQLTQVWDPEWFKELVTPMVEAAASEMTLEDEFNLDDVMAGLSERERQCFVLHYGFEFSMERVAQELGIKKSSVSKHIERAKEKIEYNRTKGLFSHCS